MTFKSQAARDAQAGNYGDQRYWEYLDESAESMAEHFRRKGDQGTADSMFTRSLSEALRGNEGD